MADVIDLAGDDAAPPPKRLRQSDVVDLCDDDEGDAPAPPPAAMPRWKRQRGVKRILGEVLDLQRQVARGEQPQLSRVRFLDDDDPSVVRFDVANFDDALPGGRQLNLDLAALARHPRARGQAHITMEIRFPRAYPDQPPFLRCVSPRFVWYTGHVTAGGAICTEALTLSGTPRSWTPDLSVEGVLSSVLLNFVDCESVVVRTASGPGGRSGPLRVDLDGRFHPDVMREYSEHEALAAFERMRELHRRNGW